MVTTPHTRPATAQDLPDIHRLVGELADYENEPEAFTASLEDYQQDFSDGVFEAIVAEEGDEIVGMALFYLTYSTWKGRMLYLEDFVVAQAHRRKGIGQALFDAFLDRARALNCRLVKWEVLDWNQPAINFYERNNATIEKNWWDGKIFLQ